MFLRERGFGSDAKYDIILAVRDPKKGSFPSSPMEPTDDCQGYRMSLIGQLSAPHGLFSNQLASGQLFSSDMNFPDLYDFDPHTSPWDVPCSPTFRVHPCTLHILFPCEGL